MSLGIRPTFKELGTILHEFPIFKSSDQYFDFLRLLSTTLRWRILGVALAISIELSECGERMLNVSMLQKFYWNRKCCTENRWYCNQIPPELGSRQFFRIFALPSLFVCTLKSLTISHKRYKFSQFGLKLYWMWNIFQLLFNVSETNNSLTKMCLWRSHNISNSTICVVLTKKNSLYYTGLTGFTWSCIVLATGLFRFSHLYCYGFSYLDIIFHGLSYFDIKIFWHGTVRSVHF